MANEFVTRTGLIVSGSTFLPSATSASKGYILSFDDSTKQVYYMATSSVTVTVPGSDTQVIYNNGGSFGASSNFVFSGSNVGIGTTSPSAKLTVKGSGTTSSTTALLIQNANASSSLIVKDDGQIQVSSTSVANPGYSFIDNTDTGLYMVGGTMGTVVDGQYSILYGADGPSLYSNTTNSITSANLLMAKIGSNHRMSIWMNGSNNFQFQAWESGVGYNNNIILQELGGNVGIGTSSPSYKLDVYGSPRFYGDGNHIYTRIFSGASNKDSKILIGNDAERFNIGLAASSNTFSINSSNGGTPTSINIDYTTGNVGIGTTSPQNNLHISGAANGTDAGNLRIDSTDQYGGLVINENTTFRTILGYGNAGNIFSNAQSDSTALRAANYLHLGASSAATLTINGSDNVGIGTTSPNAKLDVNGNVIVTGSLTVSGSSTFTNIGPAVFTGSITQNASTASFGGLVGIGTTTPSTPLEISHATGNALKIATNDATTNNNAGIIIENVASSTSTTRRSVLIMDPTSGTGTGGDYFYITSYGNGLTSLTNAKSDGILVFGTADTERIRITSAGDVGIGTSSPTAKLDVRTDTGILVRGASGTTDGRVAIIPATGGRQYGLRNYGSSFGIIDESADVVRMFFHNNGNTGIANGTTTPTDTLQVEGGRISVTSGSTFGLSIEASGSGGRGGIISTKAGSDWNPVMYFTSQSRVGIGTGTPEYTFDVNGSARIVGNTYVGGIINAYQGDASIWVPNLGQAFTIKQTTGNVGIGETSPSFKLVVTDTNNYQGILVNGSNAPVIAFDKGVGQTAEWKVGISGNNGESFSVSSGTANTDRFFISSSGNVGINTTTPSATLEVGGNVTATSFTGSFSGSVSAPGSTTQIVYNSGGALAASSNFVFSGSRVGIGISSPSYKLDVDGDIRSGGSDPLVILQPNSGTYAFLQKLNASNGDFLRLYDGTDYSMFWKNTNVGIGTSNPSAKLQIVSSGLGDGGGIRITNSGAGGDDYRIWPTATVNGEGAGKLIFSNNGGNVLTLTSGGNVGIGTTTPTSSLHVVGTITAATTADSGRINLGTQDTNQIGLYRDNTYDLVLVQDASSGNTLYLAGAGDVRVSIDSNNNNTNSKFIVGNNEIKSTNELFSVDESGSGYFSGSLTVQGTITAQKLNVQQITSSVVYSSGSNIFGNDISNTQTFTGSVLITGSEILNGKLYLGTTSPSTANSLQLSYNTTSGDGVVSSYSSGGSTTLALQTSDAGSPATRLYINSSGNVGIGTTSPYAPLNVKVTGLPPTSGQQGYFGNVVLQGDSGYYNRLRFDTNGTGSWGVAVNPDRKFVISRLDSSFVGTPDDSNFVIDTSGSVGIGTVNPADKLEVVGNIRATTAGAYNTISVYNTGGTGGGGFLAYQNGVANGYFGVAGWYQGNSDTGVIIGTDSSSRPIRFFTNTERMRITGDGNVGIGTTSPTDKLSVSGGGISINNSSDPYLRFRQDGNIVSDIFTDTSGNNLVVRGSSGVGVEILANGASEGAAHLVVSGSGNVGIGTTSPSALLHLSSTSPLLKLTNTSDGAGAGSIQFYSGSTQVWNLGTYTDNDFYLYNNNTGTYNLWVDNASGNTGVGVVNPNSKLVVARDVTDNDLSQYGYVQLKLIGSSTQAKQLLLGFETENNYGFIQTLQDGASWSTYNLALQWKGGNVGVGTRTPNYKLHVDADTDSLFKVSNGTETYIKSTFYGYSSGYDVIQIGDVYGKGNNGVSVALGIDPSIIAGGAFSGYEIALPELTEFITANGPSGSATDWNQAVLVITGSNIGIGTGTPSYKLDVNGTGRFASGLDVDSYILTRTKLQISNGRLFELIGTSDALNIYDGSAGASRIYISGSGNVGIGTTSPSYKLDIAGVGRLLSVGIIQASSNSDTPNIAFTNNGTSFTWGTIGGLLQGDGDGALFFNTKIGGSVTEKMRITSAGNVGIGTTSPSTILNIASTSPVIRLNPTQNNSTAIEFGVLNAGTNAYARIDATNEVNFDTNLRFYTNATSSTTQVERMRITSAGNVGIGTTSPSYRLQVSGSIAIENQGTTTIESTTFSGSLTSNTNIAFVPTASFKAAFFDYYVASGSVNLRAGTVMAVHNNSTSRYTDTSTADIGTTAAVDFSTSVIGGSLVLTANISSGTWEVKTAYRAL